MRQLHSMPVAVNERGHTRNADVLRPGIERVREPMAMHGNDAHVGRNQLSPRDDPGLSRKICVVWLMLPAGSRTICII